MHNPANTREARILLNCIPPTSITMDFAFVFTFPALRYNSSKHALCYRRLSRKQSRTPSSSLDDKCILTVDLGTSSAKAALISATSGRLLSPLYRSAYTLHTPARFPCNPTKAGLAARAFRNSETSVPDVSAPALLRNDALLYCDARSFDNATRLSVLLGREIAPTDLLPKLALLPVDSQHGSYSLLLSAADFAVVELGGAPCTDATNVSTTGLSSAPHRSYDSALLERAGLGRLIARLPRIQSEICVGGSLSIGAAAALGAAALAGTPLVHAGGD
eukprot:IDg7841t1